MVPTMLQSAAAQAQALLQLWQTGQTASFGQQFAQYVAWLTSVANGPSAQTAAARPIFSARTTDNPPKPIPLCFSCDSSGYCSWNYC
jgi:hypothetical protein